MTTTAEKLIGLLDYVEQVVRLDERVAHRLSDYRLPDGTGLIVPDAETRGLPGVLLDARDDEGPIWLSVERLARCEPPAPPDALAPWLSVPSDPAKPVRILDERLITVSAAERNALVAAEHAIPEDFQPVPERQEDSVEPSRFDLRLRLDDHPAVRAQAQAWIAGPLAAWAAEETLRRRTIALYGKLYKLQQQLELGGAESAVEAVWGIGPVRWRSAGALLDRPLLERGVELELDEGGLIRVRPTEADARFDLKPYEAFECDNLAPLEDTLRREIGRSAADEGVSPFRRDTFEPALIAAATRLAPNGAYLPAGDAEDGFADHPGPVVTDGWVLFGRPRSNHVLLDDIARFRTVAAAGEVPVSGLAERLVNPPAEQAGTPWAPLSATLGTVSDGNADDTVEQPGFGDVFFPKPFNEDQVAIVRLLAAGDGLVVQGPPGTGKTHTIANLICHAMALGQRVLVVSRGEAALAVLRDQLPEKVRPLTISILSNERQGLRQVETAIREIQSSVEESRPEIRRSAIRRCEAEILKIRDRLASIDLESEGIAARQGEPLGPGAETPADLARRLAAERQAHAWFSDRPERFASETSLTNDDMDALADARGRIGDLLDHADANLPPLDALPGPDAIAAAHGDLRRARSLEGIAAQGPAISVHLDASEVEGAELCAKTVRDCASAWERLAGLSWLTPHLGALGRGEPSPWADALAELCLAWSELDRNRAELLPMAVVLPDGLVEDATAREAIQRAAGGGKLWPLMSVGKGTSKALVAAVRLKGSPPAETSEDWGAVAAQIGLVIERRELAARWRTFALEAGAPGADPGADLGTVAGYLRALERMGAGLALLRDGLHGAPAFARLAEDATLARAFAGQIEDAAQAARLASVEASLGQAVALFGTNDRTSVMARQILRDLVGREDLEPERIAALWTGLLAQVDKVHARAASLATIREITARIAAEGAPDWARRLAGEPPAPGGDALLPSDWRPAWDAGAGAAALARIEGRDALLALAREREAADRRGRKLFVELVRERAFHALERRLSPRVKSALVEYVRALGRLGKGTGKGAGQHRRTAREAMARCYDAVPCWIMPTWRVAEQLPSDLAAFDLVILDEASQSDVTELPALLRGKKILAVGDDRQVSPTPPFVTQAKIEQLRHHYLRDLPYKTLLEPGESLYDLMRAVFPDNRLMLKEHFRCVEPIIRFSMQFYPEKLLPLRIPSATERLDPPLVDIFVPHGQREGARKINRAEAEVIVDEITAMADDPALRHRSVGIISLIGGDQAELIRVMLTERIGEEAMQRHKILCGDSATFQGNERDVVFLSLVADRKRRTTLTMLRYEQRFNVAASRARDRLVLVRSVELADLHSSDLKARLIAHFADPVPARATPTDDRFAACDSDFERDVMGRLVDLGYAVEPQVGAQGFRIDLVVEGENGRRLAVECDGDRFHGPEQWRDDMRRQRILERVGWRFWRCFASSFYCDPDGVMADLLETLRAQEIEPVGRSARAAARPTTEHRTIVAPAVAAGDPEAREPAPGDGDAALGRESRIGVGDRVALVFPDSKRMTLRLTEDADDLGRGLLSVATPFGRAVAAAEEGEELDLAHVEGMPAKVLVEAVERAA